MSWYVGCGLTIRRISIGMYLAQAQHALPRVHCAQGSPTSIGSQNKPFWKILKNVHHDGHSGPMHHQPDWLAIGMPMTTDSRCRVVPISTTSGLSGNPI